MNDIHAEPFFFASVGCQKSKRLIHIPPQKGVCVCVCVYEEPNASHASGPVILVDQFPGG